VFCIIQKGKKMKKSEKKVKNSFSASAGHGRARLSGRNVPPKSPGVVCRITTLDIAV
jgi:hypothetical protein